MKSNKSLKLLLQYETESSDDESSSSSSSSSSSLPNFRNYRNKNEISDDSENDVNSDDDYDKLSTVETESVCSDSGDIIVKRTRKNNNIDSYPEEDLPPVETLSISVPSDHCQAIGTIKHLIDEMTIVVVQSYRNQAALNIDSVLFLDCGRRVLGKIYDVFGQVQQPQYVIRFGSCSQLNEANLTAGMIVYAAPKLPFTIYVFMKDVLANRGSDASWIDDCEAPPECVEFSDDETEREFKRTGQAKKRQRSSK